MVCGVLCSFLACATDGRCLEVCYESLRATRAIFGSRNSYCIKAQRNKLLCTKSFLRGKLYKNHSSSCYEQASNSLYGLKKGESSRL